MVSKADRHRKPHKRRATCTPVSIRLLKQLGDGVEQGKCYWVIPPYRGAEYCHERDHIAE